MRRRGYAVCTVHLNGRAVRSCQTLFCRCQPANHAIEGLSANGTHAVQLAWEELDVPQCGYCQAGQMMTASALLAHTPSPTDEQIEDAMNGNICRCGTIEHPVRRSIAPLTRNGFAQPTKLPVLGAGKE